MQIIAISVILFLVALVVGNVLLSLRDAAKKRKVLERRKGFKIVQ